MLGDLGSKHYRLEVLNHISSGIPSSWTQHTTHDVLKAPSRLG